MSATMKTIHARRKRRQAKAGAKPRHRLVGGRTGSVRCKQRHGQLIERVKRAPRTEPKP